MNKIDLENIKKELDKRIAENYTFENGGEMSKDEIISKPTEELNKLVDDFKNGKKKQAAEEIKKLVDLAFEKYSTGPTDNMIVIGACNYYDEDRYVSKSDNAIKDVNFDGFGGRYNKLAHPIGRDYDYSYYDYNKRQDVGGADDAKMDELLSISHQIEDKFKDLGIENVEDYWIGNDDAINEVWYGVHGITKDYKIVAFVIRNDGMLCDEDSFDSFHNKIICRL